MRVANYLLVGLAFIVYFFVFGEGAGFFLPFTMTPLLINAALARLWRTFWSQAVVLVATIAYSGWFLYVYLYTVEWHPDPQGSLAFFFVGIYALPVLLGVWLISYAVEWYSLAQSQPSTSGGLQSRKF